MPARIKLKLMQSMAEKKILLLRYNLWGLLLYCLLCFSHAHGADWITISADRFTMGDTEGDANEAPALAEVNEFQIMKYEVTNREFSSFVKATGYVTDTIRNGQAYVWTKRWYKDSTANYLRPHGGDSSTDTLDDHPVVQVSARDALTYCMYHGARLPTETEWEFAARGTDGRRYPWGQQAPDQSAVHPIANYGTDVCCAPEDADGYKTTSPVGSFPRGRSPFGIHDMAGNVWEWTSSPFPGRPEETVIRGGGWGNNPYCLRASYRHGNPPNISLNMVGFRCAR